MTRIDDKMARIDDKMARIDDSSMTNTIFQGSFIQVYIGNINQKYQVLKPFPENR